MLSRSPSPLHCLCKPPPDNFSIVQSNISLPQKLQKTRIRKLWSCAWWCSILPANQWKKLKRTIILSTLINYHSTYARRSGCILRLIASICKNVPHRSSSWGNFPRYIHQNQLKKKLQCLTCFLRDLRASLAICMLCDDCKAALCYTAKNLACHKL